MIINLPVTVEMSLPHIYANQIEYCSDRLKYRDAVILSTHPHNDRGTGVADTELAVLAGAQRVECCLFGNGERTGNVDAITLAMNMYTHGVDPKLDFSNMPEIVAVYERLTRMHVHDRHPYAGSLVFAAFSGSHQDAIAKGMKFREERNSEDWTVPYIPLDPTDISRTYDSDVIRVNSQSGKGGIGYIMEKRFGYNLPARMRENLGYTVKDVSDRHHAELKPDEIMEIFDRVYVNKTKPVIEVKEAHFVQGRRIRAVVDAFINGEEMELFAEGNGRINAVNNAIKKDLICSIPWKVMLNIHSMELQAQEPSDMFLWSGRTVNEPGELEDMKILPNVQFLLWYPQLITVLIRMSEFKKPEC